MTHNELRQKYLDFFKSKGHAIIAPSKLVPENDPTTLFTSSGMQQLVPNLKGEPHPMGARLTDSQPSFRAEDIEEVGDNRHTTFFEMLGNWSLGDYFKKEQLVWFYQFLTQELGISKDKLYVTVFAGNEFVDRDEESISIWQELFKTNIPAKLGIDIFDPKTKIYMYDAKKNWWSRSGTPDKMPVGEIGGPDSEMFYDFGDDLKLHEKSQFKDQTCHVNCDCGRFIEIGNSVFMQYEKQKDDSFNPLPKQNVDFGGGLERILMAVQNKQDIFETTIFASIISEIEISCKKKYKFHRGDLGFEEMPDCWAKDMSAMRIIADHLRAATFMITDGVEPSNKQQGYILRRLLRRSAVKMNNLQGGLTPIPAFQGICDEVLRIYDGVYFERGLVKSKVGEVIENEISKFGKTLDKGLKEIEKRMSGEIGGKVAFDLYQTYGFPVEITAEILEQKGRYIDMEEFIKAFYEHKEKSRTASKGMFAGGLADHSEAITKLHTATHLLNQALRTVLGRDDIVQVGSNITAERLRFDFTYPDKLTEEQMKQVEDIVNEQIKKDLLVSFQVMDKDEALKVAVGAFSERYGDKVKVYSIGSYSKEICGGPHVERTGVLGKFKLGKQEAVGAGKRRIYGYLHPVVIAS